MTVDVLLNVALMLVSIGVLVWSIVRLVQLLLKSRPAVRKAQTAEELKMEKTIQDLKEYVVTHSPEYKSRGSAPIGGVSWGTLVAGTKGKK